MTFSWNCRNWPPVASRRASWSASRRSPIQVTRTAFPAPDGFDSPIEFHAIGLTRGRRSWSLPSSGYRTLAVAPFANQTGLAAVSRLGGDDRILVSRQEELDKLSEDVLAEWNEVFVLSDTAQGEAEDVPAETDEDDSGTGSDARPSGLHAKMIAVEHGWDVTWSVGSANLTSAAFAGSNVEMMASVTGKRGARAAPAVTASIASSTADSRSCVCLIGESNKRSRTRA